MPMYQDSDWERRSSVAPTTLEPEDYRADWRRDCARLIHSPCFRRLQGKTQLFPGFESDFFRNRLTHSLEVAQIAKSIAIRLNSTEEFLEPPEMKILPDVCEFSGLAHDLGHPPFGHQGELALDALMKSDGGFEGNAQTLRILSRLEKRDNPIEDLSGIHDDGEDKRIGLNLSARTVASILKYDHKILKKRKKNDLISKGFYAADEETVRWVKNCVVGAVIPEFGTLECSIMDAADDIAYSTYDLEDSLKAGFLTPLQILSDEGELIERVAERAQMDVVVVSDVLRAVFSGVSRPPDDAEIDLAAPEDWLFAALVASRASEDLSQSGYKRTGLTSQLVGEFIRGVSLKPKEECPPLSSVKMSPDVKAKVAVLKHLAYEALIMSPRVVISQFRAAGMIQRMFEALSDEDLGVVLHDYRHGSLHSI